MNSLGDRMKRYEQSSKQFLTRRMPVIVRLDGKAFHTFTRGLGKPFDKCFMLAMSETMKQLCENIQGCVFGYTQSDEISLVLIDYKELNSEAWFDYQVQKMCSVSASMATLYFNNAFRKFAQSLCKEQDEVYSRKFYTALFDSRVFNVPKEDVANCILWRQNDATRNSILGTAQAFFSQKEMQGISCDKLQDKLFLEKGLNWNELEVSKKRGTSCIKAEDGSWKLDEQMPIISQNRDYVNKAIFYNE